MHVKFQNDTFSITSNIAASRFGGKTSYRLVKRGPASQYQPSWKEEMISCKTIFIKLVTKEIYFLAKLSSSNIEVRSWMNKFPITIWCVIVSYPFADSNGLVKPSLESDHGRLTTPQRKLCSSYHINIDLLSMTTSSNGNISALLDIYVGNSPVTGEFPSQAQRRGALVFSLISAWINGWVNNGAAGDSGRHRAHYDVIIMQNAVEALLEFNNNPFCVMHIFHEVLPCTCENNAITPMTVKQI